MNTAYPRRGLKAGAVAPWSDAGGPGGLCPAGMRLAKERARGVL